MLNHTLIDNSGHPNGDLRQPENIASDSGERSTLADALFRTVMLPEDKTGMLPPTATERLSDEQLMERISVNPDVCGGQPCIRGTRTPIWIILGALADGLMPQQVVNEYPHLTLADVQAALLYAAHQAMDTPEDDDL